MESTQGTSRRRPLTRGRVLEAALHLVDAEGLDALTMRRLGAELGVEAMSLYKHVANKEAILDGIVELVVGEIETPSGGVDWRSAMRRRAISAREVLGRHSWAVGLLESRASLGATALQHVEAILATLRSAGFSIENAAHAFWLLDCYVYGQVIQEISLPYRTSSDMTGESSLEQVEASDYPHLVELVEHAGMTEYSVDREFEFGLDLILDALGRIGDGAAH